MVMIFTHQTDLSVHYLIAKLIFGVNLLVTLLLFGCRKTETPTTFSNRLAQASSPYLREHADNPVDWYEWGEEALEKAKQEDKPIIISIGYAACHWCHVMEEESFMDTAVARIMNENFVSIKIDREERPDIDQIYITAAQLIAGNAGWPLNAFALPDGKPFYAGTYFTKDQWTNLLTQISTTYREYNNRIVKQADAVTRGVLEHEVIKPIASKEAIITANDYKNIVTQWETQIDFSNGGLSGAPKFPMPVVWEFLLQDYYHTKNEKALEAVTVTLDRMAMGGIYDHLGGGFARYSTDDRWKIPHFEKMLYDNGQLVSLYSHAFQVTNSNEYQAVVAETLDFIKRELTSPEGGFYSSLNADSEGKEGTYYVWTKSEIEKILDKTAASLFIEYYTISEEGNWEEKKNVLHRETSIEALSKKFDLEVDKLQEILSTSGSKLVEVRNKKIRPSLDDKILTAWNALMLTGYVDAYWALGKKEYLEIAIKNGQFLRSNMLREGGQLWRSYSNGKASIDAFLDDYALLAQAFIKLYEATFDIAWLDLSRSVTDYALLHFDDKQTGFFFYTPSSSQLVARKMETSDQVIPSSNSVMADVLFRLGHYYDEKDYLNRSEKMIQQMADEMLDKGPYYANWARLIGRNIFQPYEVAIMGEDHVLKSNQLMKSYLPDILLLGGKEENLPLLQNKYVTDKTIIYVCRDKVCKLPVTEVEKALEQIQR